MDALTKLAEELSFPSGDKLFVAARKRNIDITRAQALEVASKGVREIFRPTQRQQGSISARSPGAKVQIDLMDFTQHSIKENAGFRFVLIAIDVFTRKIYCEVMKNKLPQTTLTAWKKLEAKMGPMERVDSDNGGEYVLLEKYLKEKTSATP